MSLTDDWKEGRLEGDYWVRLIKPTGEYIERITIAKGSIPYNKDPCVVILEVLARCDYYELQHLKGENADLQESADALRELNKIMRRNYDKKVENLHSLLKESCNELKIFRTLSLPLASQEALNECDVLLTRLHAAIGESEE